MASKDELLAAIAAAGTRGQQAYEAAQASIEQQKAAAIQQALSSSIAGNAPESARAQLSQTISAPYQQRQAALTSNAAASQDFYGRLGASAGVFTDQVNALGPALTQQYEQNLALKMAGSSAKEPKEPTQFEMRSAIEKFARTQDPGGKPWWVKAREIAQQQGVPSKDAESWFGPSGDYGTVADALDLNIAESPVFGPKAERALLPSEFAAQAKGYNLDPTEYAYLVKAYTDAYGKKSPQAARVLKAVSQGRKNPRRYVKNQKKR